MEEDNSEQVPQLMEHSPSRLEEFLSIVGESSIMTDLILVSFIPEWIKYEPFCKLMDTILSQLVSQTVRSAKTSSSSASWFCSFLC